MATDAFHLKPPLVTVTIPAYNAEAFVAEAIDSVLMQDYPNMEVIVCDDGSSDRTLEILRGYGDRIRVIRHPRNRGLGVTRNTLLHEARGTMLALIDADDLWLPAKISTQVAMLTAHPEAALCHCATENFGTHIGDGPMIEEIRGKIFGRCFTTLFKRNGIHPSATLVRIAAMPASGFYEDLNGTEDYAMWLHLLANHEAVYLPQTLARVRRHDTQMTSGIRRMQIYSGLGRLRTLRNAPHNLNAQEKDELLRFALDELETQAYSRYWNKDFASARLGFSTLDSYGRRIRLRHRLRARLGTWL